jgi:hypothetical protein
VGDKGQEPAQQFTEVTICRADTHVISRSRYTFWRTAFPKSRPFRPLRDSIEGCPLSRRSDVAIAFQPPLGYMPRNSHAVISLTCYSTGFVMQVWRSAVEASTP